MKEINPNPNLTYGNTGEEFRPTVEIELTKYRETLKLFRFGNKTIKIVSDVDEESIGVLNMKLIEINTDDSFTFENSDKSKGCECTIIGDEKEIACVNFEKDDHAYSQSVKIKYINELFRCEMSKLVSIIDFIERQSNCYNFVKILNECSSFKILNDDIDIRTTSIHEEKIRTIFDESKFNRKCPIPLHHPIMRINKMFGLNLGDLHYNLESQITLIVNSDIEINVEGYQEIKDKTNSDDYIPSTSYFVILHIKTNDSNNRYILEEYFSKDEAITNANIIYEKILKLGKRVDHADELDDLYEHDISYENESSVKEE